MVNLPDNPAPGMIVEVANGVFYQYDNIIRSWIEVLRTSLSNAVATSNNDGIMPASDLIKLNRLVIPPPKCTLTANSCGVVFGSGNLALRSLDNIVNVNGTRNVVYKDNDGTLISQELPYHIHQHTYGFDFGINLDNLVSELQQRGLFNVVGNPGLKGPKGKTGPPGIQQTLTGPTGDQGDPGDSPPCVVQLQRETIPANTQNLSQKVIVGLSVSPNVVDHTKYQLVVQRQNVGTINAAGTLNVKSDNSSWILALSSTANNQPIYYIDIDPIVETIHQKFLSEVQRLKSGFEAVVTMWLQKMSGLFDEQKLALCCALEFCQSRQANTASRQHIESTTAAAVGKGSVAICNPGSGSDTTFPVAPNCNPVPFPTGGSPAPTPTPEPTPTPTPTPTAMDCCNGEQIRGTWSILGDSFGGGFTFQPNGEYTRDLGPSGSQCPETPTRKIIRYFLTCTDDGVSFRLVRTCSICTIEQQQYSIITIPTEVFTAIQFELSSTGQAVGNTPAVFCARTQAEFIVVHGHCVGAPTQTLTASTHTLTAPAPAMMSLSVTGPTKTCTTTINQLRLLERAWHTGQCAGAVISLYDQYWIVIKTDAVDMGQCSQEYNGAYAWPTFDGNSFAGITDIDSTEFLFESALSSEAIQILRSGTASNVHGNLELIDLILFPTA